MRTGDRLVDRAVEATELRTLANAGEPRMALLFGRRRVGKTYLLNALWPRERAFYFTASATSPEINRRVLVEEAARWSGRELRPEDHPTWRTVFRSVLALAPDRDLVVVLDEVQYLATDEAGLGEVTSELNAVWEAGIARSGGLLLVLSGSAVRVLEGLAGGGAPLYGRLHWTHRLQPFDYFDAGEMVPGYAPRDRVRIYAAFGGLPPYLQAIRTTSSVEDNIVRLLLHPRGVVRLQLETALAQEEGLRERAKYQAILETVGLKRRALGEIAAALNQPVDTALRAKVAQLVELGLLEAERDFDAPRNRPVRYRIADPALRFHYGLVLPNESAIASAGAEAVWRERIAPNAFPRYVGQHAFEDVVRQAYLRLAAARGLPPVAAWSRWAGRDRHRRDVEIDIAARRLDGGVLTGAVKFQTRPADARVFLDHVEALRRLADSGRQWAREALATGAPLLFVSAGGFADSFHAAAGATDHAVHTWTLADLYGSAGPAA